MAAGGFALRVLGVGTMPSFAELWWDHFSCLGNLETVCLRCPGKRLVAVSARSWVTQFSFLTRSGLLEWALD